MILKKIVSGGQTGVDRAALDAGLESTFPIGGYCPSGRLAEDGVIDSRYPLKEIAGGYRQRTRMNVESSDGTLIFYQSDLIGGTELTLSFCLKLKKPYKLIDLDLASVESAVPAVLAFIDKGKISVLNVAGPRASNNPALSTPVKQILLKVIARASSLSTDA